jgi:hypothetical protein
MGAKAKTGPPRKAVGGLTEAILVRLSTSQLRAIDKIVQERQQQFSGISRSDVVRDFIMQGLQKG